MIRHYRLPLLSFLSLCLIFGLATPCFALINPKVQPKHLYEQYATVVVATIVEQDIDGQKLVLEVNYVAKGEAKPERIVMTADETAGIETVLSVSEGQQIVAFLGQAGRRGKDKVLYYVGGGQWYVGRLPDPTDLTQVTILKNADEGLDPGSESIMFGVFNGAIEQLARLVEDEANDRAYYPATAFTRFEATQLLQADEPMRGVGLVDLNGDGRLDVIATGDAGVRVMHQTQAGAFEDVTQASGLADVVAKSVSAADVDLDGDLDLLLDAVIYINKASHFTATPLLPRHENVLSAAFVEINGDGLVDVMVSESGGGLHVYLQNADDDTTFKPVRDAWGLADDALAEGSGYFEPTDWDNDGDTDLLYLAGPGYLLLADEGRFSATPIGSEDEGDAWTTAAVGRLTSSTTPGAGRRPVEQATTQQRAGPVCQRHPLRKRDPGRRPRRVDGHC